MKPRYAVTDVVTFIQPLLVCLLGFSHYTQVLFFALVWFVAWLSWASWEIGCALRKRENALLAKPSTGPAWKTTGFTPRHVKLEQVIGRSGPLARFSLAWLAGALRVCAPVQLLLDTPALGVCHAPWFEAGGDLAAMGLIVYILMKMNHGSGQPIQALTLASPVLSLLVCVWIATQLILAAATTSVHTVPVLITLLVSWVALATFCTASLVYLARIVWRHSGARSSTNLVDFSGAPLARKLERFNKKQLVTCARFIFATWALPAWATWHFVGTIVRDGEFLAAGKKGIHATPLDVQRACTELILLGSIALGMIARVYSPIRARGSGARSPRGSVGNRAGRRNSVAPDAAKLSIRPPDVSSPKTSTVVHAFVNGTPESSPRAVATNQTRDSETPSNEKCESRGFTTVHF